MNTITRELNHTMGVAVATRSRVFFWAGFTKNEVPCCFNSMVKAAVGMSGGGEGAS